MEQINGLITQTLGEILYTKKKAKIIGEEAYLPLNNQLIAHFKFGTTITMMVTFLKIRIINKTQGEIDEHCFPLGFSADANMKKENGYWQWTNNPDLENFQKEIDDYLSLWTTNKTQKGDE